LLTINGLTAADSVLVPLQCEYYALEGLSALLETVELIRKRLNPGLRIEGVLLTMFDTRNSLSHQVSEEVHRHFPQTVFQAVIPRNVRLSEAPSHGLPAVVYDPSSRGALAYRALADELLGVRRTDIESAVYEDEGMVHDAEEVGGGE
jgi:chromosome partitioning protein